MIKEQLMKACVRRVAGTAAVCFLLMSAASHADMLTLTQSFEIGDDLSAYNESNDSAYPFASRSFGKFDPSLGTLNSVRIALTSLVLYDVSIVAEPDYATDGFGGEVQFDVHLQVLLDGLEDLFNFQHPYIAACSGGGDSDGCENSNSDSDFFSDYWFLDDPYVLASFIRTESSTTFTLDPVAELLLEVTACAGANVDVSCWASSWLSWTSVSDVQGRLPQLVVSYEYTPAASIPEPGSLALLGLGLAGLGLSRTRRAN